MELTSQFTLGEQVSGDYFKCNLIPAPMLLRVVDTIVRLLDFAKGPSVLITLANYSLLQNIRLI